MIKTILSLCCVALFAAATTPTYADTFSLQGTGNFSGQGFGTLYNLLVLHNNGTETGSVEPTFPGGAAVLTGDATNTSSIVTAADLAAIGITSSSQFGLLYNVNQQGDGSAQNTFITGFDVTFYNSAGGVLFDATFAGGATPFHPDGNGQGTSGYLFELDHVHDFSQVAYIGMSGTITNANDGADGFSVGNTGQAQSGVTPEPSSLMLLGTGIIGAAGLIRRRLLA